MCVCVGKERRCKIETEILEDKFHCFLCLPFTNLAKDLMCTGSIFIA